MSFFKKEKEAERDPVVDKVLNMYRNSYANKSTLNKNWDTYYKAYTGEYFKQNLPVYKNQNIENFVFSTIETVKPVMLSENPKILALPQSEDMQTKSDSVQKALDYEWQRTHMMLILGNVVTNTLLYGKGIIGVLWDKESQNGLGNVRPIVIPPFNFFIDPSATNIDDAEYAIYATYKNVGELAKAFPDNADEIKNSSTQPSDAYLNHGKITDSVSMMRNQVLYIEAYFRDYSTELTEEQDESGNTTKTEKLKYPKGRLVMLAGDVLLHDGENAYEDGKFPFCAMNCYDMPGEFWGMGEVEQIISPTNSVNLLTNSIIETAELTSNPIWIMDKNSGVAKGSLTNRKGLVIRKNPGTEVRREQPPSLPAYIQNIIDILKADIENISGVYDVTRGQKPTGITAAAAIQALSEQAQGRIKLKVQNLEYFLGEVGGMWLSRIQQYWVSKRTIRVMGVDYKPSFDTMCGDDVDGDFDISIVAGSTMPVNKSGKLQQMVQLAQTHAEDGLPVVDRQTMLENADIANLQEVLKRFKDIKEQQAQQQQEQIQQQAQAQAQQMQAQQQQIQQQQQFEMQMEQMKMQGQQNSQVQGMQQQHQGQIDQLTQQHQQELQQRIPTDQVGELISRIPPDVLMQIAQSNPKMLDILNQISNNQELQKTATPQVSPDAAAAV